MYLFEPRAEDFGGERFVNRPVLRGHNISLQ